jgi:hypothetical protein
MSDIINPKEFPHELLIRRHNINMSELSSNTQQLKADFDQTLQIVLRKSKDGEIKLTAPTQRKLTTYDQYICDGIFSYLEEQNKITEAQVEKEEEKLEEKREEVEEKLEEAHEEEKVEAQKVQEKETKEQVEQKPQSATTDKKEDSMWDLFDF